MDTFHAETFVNVGRSLSESQSNLIAMDSSKMDSSTPLSGIIGTSVSTENDCSNVTSSNSSMNDDSHLMRSAIIVQNDNSDNDGLGYDNYFGDEEKVEMSMDDFANHDRKKQVFLEQRLKEMLMAGEKFRKEKKQRAFDRFIADLGEGYVPEEVLQCRWEDFEKLYDATESTERQEDNDTMPHLNGIPLTAAQDPLHVPPPAANPLVNPKRKSPRSTSSEAVPTAHHECHTTDTRPLPISETHGQSATATVAAAVTRPAEASPPASLSLDTGTGTPLSIPQMQSMATCSPRNTRPFTTRASPTHLPHLLPDWGCDAKREMAEQWGVIQALQTQLTQLTLLAHLQQQQQQLPQDRDQPRCSARRGDFLAVAFYNACCRQVAAVKQRLVAAGRAVVAGVLCVSAWLGKVQHRLIVLCILCLLLVDWCVSIVCAKIWEVVWVPVLRGVGWGVEHLGRGVGWCAEWLGRCMKAASAVMGRVGLEGREEREGWEGREGRVAPREPTGAGLVLAVLITGLLAARWGTGGDGVDSRQGLRRGVTRQVRQQCQQIRTLVSDAAGDQEVSGWEQTANRRCGGSPVTVQCGGGALDVRCGMSNGYDWVTHGVALDNTTRRAMFDDYLDPANRTHTHPVIDAYLFSTRLFAYARQDRAYFEAHIHTSEEEQGMTRLFQAYLKHHLLTTLGSQAEAQLLGTELRLWVGSRSVCDFESDPLMRWQLLPLDIRSNYQCEKERKARVVQSGQKYFQCWVMRTLRDALEKTWRATKDHVLGNKLVMMVRGVIAGMMT